MKKLFPYLLLFITCHAYGQDYAIGSYNYSYPITASSLEAYDFVKDSLDIADVMQIDTIPAYMHTRGIWIPGDSSISELLHIRFRKVMVQDVMMGQKAVYTPETDREQGNSVNQKSRIITYQIAMDDVITEEQKEKIKQAIDLIMFNSPGVPVVIDTVDASNSTFSANWVRVGETTAEGWYKNTIAHSNIAGSEATYKDPLPFRRIEIYGEAWETHGKIEITLNGGSPKVVDLYSPTRILPVLLHFYDVPLGIHEVKIRVLGEKNPASKNTHGLIDFYRLVR